MDRLITNKNEREDLINDIKNRRLPFRVRTDGIYEKRSNQSNKYYWAVIIRYLSEETGYFSHEMNDELLKKFAKVAEVEDEFGRDLIIVETTSGMNEARMNKYCNDIKIWASSYYRIRIPDPGEVLEPEEIKEKLIYK